MNEKVKKLLIALLQAAQLGNQKAIAAIQQIKQLADQGDQQAAALMDAMNAIAQQMQSQQPLQSQKVIARLGTKLNYVRTIKGECPEGLEVKYFKQGGLVCKKCVEKGAAGAKAEPKGIDAVNEFKKKKACGGSKMKFELGGETPQKPKKEEPKKPEQRLDPRTTKKLPGGKYPSYWTSKERQTWERLHGDNDEGAGAVENKGVGKNKCGGNVKKHQQGGLLVPFYQGGTSKGGVKRFSVSSTTGGATKYFDTKEEAKAYQRTQKPGTTVWRDSVQESSGQVLKVDRTKDKATEYGRQKLEVYNHLPYKLAYAAAQKTGKKYFAYKGKVYKTDVANGKNNITEMELHYGNNLGWTGDPKMGTKKSMQARAQYRKDINTSEKSYTKKVKKSKAPYVSSYDGGELFANFMGLASPTRWVGAIGRASRGEGNTGTFVGKVLNNMLDPQNGARENQGIFSSGLSPADEKWAAEHPVVSGITNGVIDAAVFGPKPKFTKDFKLKPNYGYKGRLYAVTQETVPMGIYEGDLNMPVGATVGKNPYIELGKQVGTTTKTITKRKLTNPGTRYVKSVSEKPTGKYNFSWSDGMPDMFPWVTATTNNNVIK